MKSVNRPVPRFRPDLVSEPWSSEPPPDALLPRYPGDEGAGQAPERPRYRPPIGVPVANKPSLGSTVLSVAFHALIVFLLITPLVLSQVDLREVDGAGGEGPAGGGGGGRRGRGGDVERLHYMHVAPAAPAPSAPTVPVPPPIPPPVVPPKEEPPKPTPPPVEQPPIPTPAPPQAAPASELPAPTPGTGGGTGNDGSAGSGPGSGGGVGAGVGTGRGSGVGPGTGGGNASIYPPTPTELFIPPLPVPDRVKGSQMVAVFEVDSTGRVLKFDFTPTRDGGYNRKLKDVLERIRFKPGTRQDGTPIRAQGSVTYLF